MIITQGELQMFIDDQTPDYNVVFAENGPAVNAAGQGTIIRGHDPFGAIVPYDEVVADITAWREE